MSDSKRVSAIKRQECWPTYKYYKSRGISNVIFSW